MEPAGGSGEDGGMPSNTRRQLLIMPNLHVIAIHAKAATPDEPHDLSIEPASSIAHAVGPKN
jgi:hypothetical protein